MSELVITNRTPSRGLVSKKKPDLSTPAKVSAHLAHLFATAGQNEFTAAIVPVVLRRVPEHPLEGGVRE